MKRGRLPIAAVGLVALIWVLAFALLLMPKSQTTLGPAPTQMVLPSLRPSQSPLPIMQVQPLASAVQSVSLANATTTAEVVTVAAPQEPVPQQVMIQFNPQTTEAERAAYIQSIGGSINKNIESLNAVVVSVPANITAQTLPASPIVVASEPDYYVSALAAPNDTYYPNQWALPVIGAPEAWETLPANLPQIVVAVIDSGVCLNHPDLVGRILSGWDFVQDDATPQDDFGHGCGVAGIIAANAGNGIGIAGVAPNAQILPLRVLDTNGIGTYSDVAAAIVYAADSGARIINLSLGGVNSSNVLQSAIDYAIAKGVTLIAAAGNTGGNILFPASYAPVIAVGSVDQNLQRSSFSSYLPALDLLAPGRDILMTKRDGTYAIMSGTSFAAPNVAGVAALEMAQGNMLVLGGSIVTVSETLVENVLSPTHIQIEASPELESIAIPAVSINNVTFEHQPYPSEDWTDALSTGTVDGNRVRITATIENHGTTAETFRVYFMEIDNTSLLGGFEYQIVTLGPGETIPVQFMWDTSGYAWNDDQTPNFNRMLKVAVWSGSITVEQTASIKVIPKPVILVHGLWSNASAWNDYKSFLQNVRPDWKGFAVGDGEAQGVMKTGEGNNWYAISNDIYTNADELKQYIEGVRGIENAWHVDIVAHSMGGLISRQYIHDFMLYSPNDGKPIASHLLMLGTPNLGSRCAEFTWNAASLFGTPSVSILQNTRYYVRNLFNVGVPLNNIGVPVSVLAGKISPNTCFEGSLGDVAVTVISARANFTDVVENLVVSLNRVGRYWNQHQQFAD